MPSEPDEDARVVDRALAASAVALSELSPTGTAHRLGAVTLGLSGVASTDMNFLVVHEPVSDPVADVAAALRAADGTGTGYGFVVREPSAQLHTFLLEQGLAGGDENEPGMLRELHERPPVPDGLVIERCRGGGATEMFCTLMGEVFGLDPSAVAAGFGDDLGAHPDVAAYLGYHGATPIGMSMGVTRDGVVGVFNVGVTIDQRRKGFGEALTWAALAGGFDAGARRAVLLASAMGEALYERMGFRRVGRYHGYIRATLHDGS